MTLFLRLSLDVIGPFIREPIKTETMLRWEIILINIY